MKNLHVRVFKNTLTVALTVIISSALIVGVVVAATTIGSDITTTGKIYQTGLGGSTFYGYQAGNSDDLSDNYNAALGYQALYSNISGSTNAALGYQALYSNTTGASNSAFGNSALYTNSTGRFNNAFGWQTLQLNTTGMSNNAMGIKASQNNTIGSYNTAVGDAALNSNITGLENVAVGYNASYGNTSATSTVAIGSNAGLGNGTFNAGEYTAVGAYALALIKTGAENNTALGYSSGYSVTTGANNILIGYQAADNLTTGGNNIVIGYDVDAPAVNSDRILNIANTIYANNLSGTGTTLATSTVGIGITNPTAKFQVSRGSGGTETLFLVGTTTVNNLLYVGSSGNVGVGTTQPTQKFDVTGNVNFTGSATTTGGTVLGATVPSANATTTITFGSYSTANARGMCLKFFTGGVTIWCYLNTDSPAFVCSKTNSCE